MIFVGAKRQFLRRSVDVEPVRELLMAHGARRSEG